MDTEGYDLTPDGLDLAPVLGALARRGVSRLGPVPDPGQLTAATAVQMIAVSNRDIPTDPYVAELRADGACFTLTSDQARYQARRDALAGGAITVEGDAAIAVALLVNLLPVE